MKIHIAKKHEPIYTYIVSRAQVITLSLEPFTTNMTPIRSNNMNFTSIRIYDPILKSNITLVLGRKITITCLPIKSYINFKLSSYKSRVFTSTQHEWLHEKGKNKIQTTLTSYSPK